MRFSPGIFMKFGRPAPLPTLRPRVSQNGTRAMLLSSSNALDFPLLSLIVFLPLLLVLFAANRAMEGFQKYREASRAATGKVTGFIAEIFGSAQAVKVANAEPRVVEHFSTLAEKLRVAKLKDRLFNELPNRVLFSGCNHVIVGRILLHRRSVRRIVCRGNPG
mgnify:CR=1 FL=1